MCIHFILRVKKGKEKKGFLAVTKSGHISKKLMFAECLEPTRYTDPFHTVTKRGFITPILWLEELR